MKKGATLIYDGTFEGFLSCVFHTYEYRLTEVKIQAERHAQPTLFSDDIRVVTEEIKADRIWTSVKKKSSGGTPNTIYYAFLSEQDNIENILLQYLRYIFDSKQRVDKDYTESCVLKTAQIAKMVGREKHRMEAFIRFRLTADEIYFAVAEPDFNVLPLILKHFKSRYADQKWLIYDLKRQYGIYYDLKRVELMNFDFNADLDPMKTSGGHFADSEMDFQKLWFQYFKSTNIESRKNMRLHVRHVPKRYWKYLSEKRPY